jgi:hypothetical protein
MAVLGTGCATTTNGIPSAAAPNAGADQPTTQDSGHTDAGNTGAGNTAPKVTTPLATARFQTDPCATLTSAQRHALGITGAGTVEHSRLGDICDWSPRYDLTYALGFDVEFDAGAPVGLANAYDAAGPGALVRLPDVHGQPAVTEPSQNTDGNCTIYLGATDRIEYVASVVIGHNEPRYRNPCSVARQIADDATATMKSTR